MSKKKKQNALGELMRALQIRGKPFMSFSFGIHCMFTIYIHEIASGFNQSDRFCNVITFLVGEYNND